MDKNRILSKIDELNKYLDELGEIKPINIEYCQFKLIFFF